MSPDGYAVLIDDKESAPLGYWFAACYTKPDLAMEMAAKMKGRMVPVHFAPATPAPEAEDISGLIHAAKNAESKLRYIGTQFNSPHFTDRYGDGPAMIGCADDLKREIKRCEPQSNEEKNDLP